MAQPEQGQARRRGPEAVRHKTGRPGEGQVPASVTALTSSGLGGGVETHYKWSALIMVSAH